MSDSVPTPAARWHRPWLSTVLALGLAAIVTIAMAGLPDGTTALPHIARQAMTEALPRWGTTEVVSEVVYGSRGFDTFGETFLLLAAVMAVVVLSRGREPRHEYVGEAGAGRSEQAAADPADDTDESEREARVAESEEQQDVPAPDDADDDALGQRAPERAIAMTVVIRIGVRIAAVILAVIGVYLAAWGYTPGGGFPAGLALAGVIVLLYTAFGHRAVRPVVRPRVLEIVEMAGAAAIIGVGILGLIMRGSMFDNWLPLAPQQTIRAGGTLQAFSGFELVEVATSITIAIFALLGMGHDWTPDEERP